ncbi:hypothetical protein BB561_004907 [Smittium simulii]|uniref:Single-stranded DNA-binding protein n=1 Tax=Smittium simulii TaxID=133385 RepID=A0A2T9YDI2_9FUNG|nr:hypothetical protein BB561_004907 [Smittium simulii]
MFAALRSLKTAAPRFAQARSISYVNKVIIQGSVGQDPEIKQISEDRKIAKLSVATSYVYKDAEGNLVKKTDWHRITAFGKIAELVERNVKKGNVVFIEGKINYGTYTNEAGAEIYTTDIIADKIQASYSTSQAIEMRQNQSQENHEEQE